MATKKELTVSEFRELIREEAMKLKKRVVLENEKRALQAELEKLNENYMEGMESEMGEETMEEGLMEEGVLDYVMNLFAKMDKGGKRDDFFKLLQPRINAIVQKGLAARPGDAEVIEILKNADADNYDGALKIMSGKIVYVPASEIQSTGGGFSGGLGA